MPGHSMAGIDLNDFLARANIWTGTTQFTTLGVGVSPTAPLDVQAAAVSVNGTAIVGYLKNTTAATRTRLLIDSLANQGAVIRFDNAGSPMWSVAAGVNITGNNGDFALYVNDATVMLALSNGGTLTFGKEGTRTITLADSTTANTAGATLAITGAAGAATNAAGGPITITTGAGAGTGAGGLLSLVGGAGGATGNGGAVTLQGGAGSGGGTTGAINVGVATTQPIGFYGATAITQRAGAAQAAVVTTGSTQTTPFGYTTAAQADAIVTLVNELRAWAVAQGFIKGAA